MKNYLTPDIDVRRGDVLSAWAGIRPLVKDPNAPDTQSLGEQYVQVSVADPWHFGVDKDPDPRIHASD